jgi:hypothetical protein
MSADSYWQGLLADPYWDGFLTAVLVCLAIELVGNAVLWLWRRHRRPTAAETPYAGFDHELDPADPEDETGPLVVVSEAPEDGPHRLGRVVPRFGEPLVAIYEPRAYVEPLRCSSGLECGGRELSPGEAFYMIPPPGDPDGPFVVLCFDDVIVEEASHG